MALYTKPDDLSLVYRHYMVEGKLYGMPFYIGVALMVDE